MRISFFRHSLLSRGGDKMVVAHANHLVSEGHEVYIITALLDTVFVVDSRIKLIQLPSKNILSTIVIALKSKIDSDIVVADIIPMACFLFPHSRRKVVYFAQDYDESYYISPLLKWVVRFFYIAGLNICRISTISVSHPLADLLRKRFNAKVFVAENGVDTSIFFPDPVQEMVVPKGDRKAVLLLSRNDRRKGFDLARVVIWRLSKKYSDIYEVWTVGENCTGIFDGIVHRDFGYACEDKLRHIMSSADIFLYPSRHEGYGLMPLEAMACGCAVVTTTAVPFAIHGENALVAQIEDCEGLTNHMVTIKNDENLRDRLIEAGKQFVSNQLLSETTKQFEMALTGLINR